jgi:cyclic pyranopterin phosphate synthase
MTPLSFSYLRLSLTDRCNFNCFNCRPALRASFLASGELLTSSELLSLVKTLTSFGLKHLRLTGGEPLLREDFRAFIKNLSALKAVERLSLTTNGYHLAFFLDDFKASGGNGINISLNTLKREKFRKWTGVDAFLQVCDNILKAKQAVSGNIKLNTILLKGFNDDEIEDFIRFSCSHELDIRFIEYFPTRPEDNTFSAYFLPSHFVKNTIEEKYGPLDPLGRDPLAGPANYFKVKGQSNRIGFINTVTDFFCGDCNRLRLTADGKLYVCLHSDFCVDLKKPLREKDQRGLLEAVSHALAHKKFYNKRHCSRSFEMSSIGG